MSDAIVTYNYRQGWGCHEKCILETYTVDGKIQRTQRAHLPGKIGPGTQICQKGVSAWQIPYNDKRILHPLKRVGERGEVNPKEAQARGLREGVVYLEKGI